ncbi:SIR2 family protein [Enterovibrio norvegicus]|uniref:SIR2 family protein n=1 Tax=Enterovibrio norvegicus TaxID=188144 RepID=UPI000C82C412|nr:SIR2 family protein [Enterovibrio norvegicus]PMI33624.1 hypothetical protein BCU47_09270 [Enterovibrio norvegicus]
MINWPESLCEELAARRAIIFIGSGISSGSKNLDDKSPPDWEKLLKNASEKFKINGEELTLVRKLIDKGSLLDAAEIIFDNANNADKRNLFDECFATPKFEPCNYHKLIQKINPKILITTNYDQLYERQCNALIAGNGYTVKKYTDKTILNDIRSKDNLIIKAHGCITEKENLILTRSDYFRIKQENGDFYKILDSLLTISTVLFLGCSMTDPDIQLILENTNISAKSDHPHYAVMAKGQHEALNKAMKKSYNIEILEYDNDDGTHLELTFSLEKLVEKIDEIKSILIQ